jgi:hypothetical protein
MSDDPLARYDALSCALATRLEFSEDDETTDAFRDEMDHWWRRMTDAQRRQAGRDSHQIDAALFGA